jgi:hypothetical protein
MLLNRMTDEIRDRVDRVGIDGDVFAGLDSDECPVASSKNGRRHNLSIRGTISTRMAGVSWVEMPCSNFIVKASLA